MGVKMKLWCCECQRDVDARLTDGLEVRYGRKDLAHLYYWVCDTCHNYVTCHRNAQDKTRPMGNIANAQMLEARRHLHAVIDPIWQSGVMTKQELYRAIAKYLGKKQYHTHEIKTINECNQAYLAATLVKKLASG